MIILTTFDLDQYVYAALAAGASGFLLKDVTPEHLVAAVRLVRSGDALLAPSITRRLVERFAAGRRPPHRRPACTGTCCRPDPARAGGAAAARPGPEQRRARRPPSAREATVKTHVARILAKLGCATGSRPSSSPTRPAWWRRGSEPGAGDGSRIASRRYALLHVQIRSALPTRAAHRGRIRSAPEARLAGQPTPRCEAAIIVNGRVVAQPVVEAPISGGLVEITGFATPAVARRLFQQLRGI